MTFAVPPQAVSPPVLSPQAALGMSIFLSLKDTDSQRSSYRVRTPDISSASAAGLEVPRRTVTVPLCEPISVLGFSSLDL